uniref:non-specific serine/threonine protein kinase n=1 Tax=Nitella axillaris TaxID=3151 RepID=A7VM71_9VIRI|nr:receptor-like kinase [Nitella axillaris]
MHISGLCCLPNFSRGVKADSTSVTVQDASSQATGSTSTPSKSLMGAVQYGERGEIISAPNMRHFSLRELKAATNNFNVKNLIGEGGYGKVYKAVIGKGPTSMTVAVKRADKMSFQGENEFRTEIALLSAICHPNLVRLLGYCNEREEQMLVYEYVPRGTLRFHLSKKAERPLTYKERIDIALGSAKAIAFLHSGTNPIIHRDIKAANILLTDSLEAKVADFGLGKLTPDGATHVSTVVKGTMGYMDPDYYMTNQLTEKSDVYSFGVVLLEIFTARSPISRGRHIASEMHSALRQGRFEDLIDPSIRGQYDVKYMERLLGIALLCCDDSPKHRPSMAEISNDLDLIARPKLSEPYPPDRPVSAPHQIADEDTEVGSSDSLANMTEYDDTTIITTHVEDWTVVAPR